LLYQHAQLHCHGKICKDGERNYREVLEFHLEGLRSSGLEIPEPPTKAGRVVAPHKNTDSEPVFSGGCGGGERVLGGGQVDGQHTLVAARL
jgi:hypothetical protein